MVIRAQLLGAIDDKVLQDLQRAYATAPERMRNEFNVIIRYAETYALARLKEYPPKRNYPADYPLRWSSPNQRKAYFASNGFGKGIPYRRTGELANNWRVDRGTTPFGGSLQIINKTSYAQYVQGDRQQGFHQDTGWVNEQDVRLDTAIVLEKQLVDTWYKVIGG